MKAFPGENVYIWHNLLLQLPSDILVRNEKEQFKEKLELMKSANFIEAKEAERSLRRYIYLLNKRLTNASKRRSLSA